MKGGANLASFEQRVKDVVGHYRKNTIVGDVKCTIVEESSSLYTMYATYFLPNSLTEIKDLEIVVDRSNQHDPHLEISLCHELGHLENALQAVKTVDKLILDPTTWLHRLRVEIMADRAAAKIYGKPRAKNVVSRWLKDEIKDSIKNCKKFVNKKAMLNSLVLFIIRYVANLFSQRSFKETRNCMANELS
jgi:hypothetical protein